MTVIHQGDQYYLPFRITHNGDIVTPESVTSVRIAVGDEVQEYPKKLSWNEENSAFLFLLKSDFTKKLNGVVECQVEIKKGDAKVHSDTFSIKIAKSILVEDW